MLPLSWSEDRVVVRAVASAHTPALHALLVECVDTVSLDPTFQEVAEREIGTLVERSVIQESQDRGFRMRSLHVGPTDGLAGYFHLTEDLPRPGEVWISMLAIRPRFRRSGVGTAAMRSLLRILSTQGFCFGLARVYLTNVPALRFWTQRGFTEVTQHRGTYVDYDQDRPCVVLRAPLDSVA